jgi:hypothetical protein
MPSNLKDMQMSFLWIPSFQIWMHMQSVTTYVIVACPLTSVLLIDRERLFSIYVSSRARIAGEAGGAVAVYV